MEATVTWPFPGFDALANGARLAPSPSHRTSTKMSDFPSAPSASSNRDESAATLSLCNRLPLRADTEPG